MLQNYKLNRFDYNWVNEYCMRLQEFLKKCRVTNVKGWQYQSIHHDFIYRSCVDTTFYVNPRTKTTVSNVDEEIENASIVAIVSSLRESDLTHQLGVFPMILTEEEIKDPSVTCSSIFIKDASKFISEVFRNGNVNDHELCTVFMSSDKKPLKNNKFVVGRDSKMKIRNLRNIVDFYMLWVKKNGFGNSTFIDEDLDMEF